MAAFSIRICNGLRMVCNKVNSPVNGSECKHKIVYNMNVITNRYARAPCVCGWRFQYSNLMKFLSTTSSGISCASCLKSNKSTGSRKATDLKEKKVSLLIPDGHKWVLGRTQCLCWSFNFTRSFISPSCHTFSKVCYY